MQFVTEKCIPRFTNMSWTWLHINSKVEPRRWEHLFSFLKGMSGSTSGNITALDFKWY